MNPAAALESSISPETSWLLEVDPTAGVSAIDRVFRCVREFEIALPCGAVSVAHSARGDGCAAYFSGRLENRSELAALGQPAFSDADVLLQAYLKWGDALLERIRGFFAWIVWDPRTRTLTCARDHLGLHPLFWARSGSRWLFSTSPLALAGHPAIRSGPSRIALAEYLCHRWPPCDETFLDRVSRLPPGHLLRVRAGGHQTERYWDPVPAEDAGPWLTASEIPKFETALEQAVRRTLGNGRAGVFLSGGIDSVTVAALAVQIGDQEGRAAPLAASLAFPHPDCNEVTIQKGVAEQLGMAQIMLPFQEAVGGEGLLPAALELSKSWPSPLQNVWSPAYLQLAEEARAQGCDTILTGCGGDEWLGVDPIYAADLIRSGNWVKLFALLASYRRSFRLPILPLARNVLWNNGLHPLLKDAWRGSSLRAAAHSIARRGFPAAYESRRLRERRLALTSAPEWIAPDPALREELSARMERRQALSQRRRRRSFYLRDARDFLDHPLTAMDFEEAFEYGRRLGIQVRHPFWDPDLVQLLYRMPPELLQQGGRSKGLVRGTLSKRFPELGFERQKKVISLEFFRSLMLEEGAKAWKQLGGARVLGEMGIVDPGKVDAEINRVLDLRLGPESYRVWDFVSAEQWARSRANAEGG